MMTLEQSKNKDYLWLGDLVDSSHVLNISCLFFVVIFYVIFPTIAQILADPRSKEGGSPHA